MATGFDFVLAAAVLLSALRALFAKGGYEAVFSLLFLGFLMAMVWMRLGAADIALVEAAVGGGLTVAILMEIVWLRESAERPHRFRAAAAVLLTGAALLFWTWEALYALKTLPAYGAVHYAHLHHQAGELGNPVTAVLLNYRGYDTLLEVGVLLLAVMAARMFQADQSPAAPKSGGLFASVMAAPLMLLAGYLLFQGTDGHGGAFQAATVLAAAAVLAALSGHAPSLTPLLHRGLLAGGFAVFVAAGALMQLFNGVFLAYPAALEAQSVFAIEAALTASIGWGLYALYRRIAGGPV